MPLHEDENAVEIPSESPYLIAGAGVGFGGALGGRNWDIVREDYVCTHVGDSTCFLV